MYQSYATNIFLRLITSLPSLGCNVIEIHVYSHGVLWRPGKRQRAIKVDNDPKETPALSLSIEKDGRFNSYMATIC